MRGNSETYDATASGNARPFVLDRRRHGLGPRLARATWPARQALDGAWDDFPCNVLGHRWKELPASFRSRQAKAQRKVEFACARCNLRAGFTS
jgi:hypothetical protein